MNICMCRVLRGHRGSVLSLCSLGGLMLSGGRDNIIRVWDMDALVCRRTLAGHRDDVMCIAGLGLESPSGSPADPVQSRDNCSQVRHVLSWHSTRQVLNANLHNISFVVVIPSQSVAHCKRMSMWTGHLTQLLCSSRSSLSVL